MIFDLDKLKTPRTYGKKIGKDRVRVYQLIKEGKLESLKIDGVVFVIDNDKDLPEPKETKTEEK